MPINRIPRLRTFGVFRDFTWPADLSDFGRYNLIYGWNGSGKTTLSRAFRDLELGRTPSQGEVTIRIDGADIKGEDFPQATLQARVFNRDYISESVFRSDGDDLKPIFVVGKDSVEKQKEADRLKQERADAETKLERARRKEQQAERELDRFCQEHARVIKEALRPSGAAGANPYNNYDKSDFQARAQKMDADGDAESHRLTQEQQDSLRAQITERPKPKIPETSYRLPELSAMAGEVADLLATTVVSATIDALKDDPARADWTRAGLGLHRHREMDTCLFCEQPLPPNRLATLEAHFSTEYERFLSRLEEHIEVLKAASRQADEAEFPKQIELYDDLAQKYAEAERGLRVALDTVRSFLDDLVRVLTEKRSRPFDQLVLEVAIPSVIPDAVEQVTSIIKEHNRACDEFDARIAAARDRLVLGMIADALNEFVRLRDAVQAAHAAIPPLMADIQHLKDEIERLEREIVEHRQPAEQLNEDLWKYLGHGELQLAIKETGYSITRNGVPANMLSEGEMTAIALLYFLKSLEDRDFGKETGVVVLDDPVSSLDGNALFLAFGLIRERTKETGQIIVLTHDFTLFRQVRNWLHKMPGQGKKDPTQRPSRFYMLRCSSNGGVRSAALDWIDPLLEKFESEYHYLFSYVYRVWQAPDATCLEDYYHVPNVARRLLEGFLAFKVPQESGELYRALQRVAYDESKKTRILRFLHTQSHGSDVAPTHDPSVLSECKSVLQDTFALMETMDSAHYSAMVELVEPPEEDGK